MKLPYKKKSSFLQREQWIKFSGIAIVLAATFMLYPIFYSMYLSLHTFRGLNVTFNGIGNFTRLLHDKTFWSSITNCFVFLIIQVPIMLILGLLFAYMLNGNVRFKGFFRMALFLPCVTSLVAYSIIFRMLFQVDGLVNQGLMALHIINSPISWLTSAFWAKVTIIIALCWRWTGYNMMFYISGLQNIPSTTLEAARIDGANKFQEFFKVVVPQLKQVIIFTSITSTIGTIQLFDEVVNLTEGGPSNATMTVSEYIYNHSFVYSSNFGYSAAMSWAVVVIIAVLSFLQFALTREKEA
jgi:lactose/L-arabinose transport system permease protein